VADWLRFGSEVIPTTLPEQPNSDDRLIGQLHGLGWSSQALYDVNRAAWPNSLPRQTQRQGMQLFGT